VAWSELKHRAHLVRAIADVPLVLGHGSELTRVFVHLLLTAQALDERSGSITMGTACDERGVLVTIHDTGHGIPAEHLARVFDPFFTTRAPGHGAGTGLAVCHGINTRHGGTVDVESTPGRGTTVSVRLPYMTSPEVVA
jgi:signal transduction histidine kinase